MKLKETEFYCVSCRNKKKQPTSSICLEFDRNDRPRLVADCKTCGCAIFKYVKESNVNRLSKKYGC